MAVYKPALLLVMAMGWVFSAVESQENLPSRPLKILVPLKLGFQEFVSWEGQPPTSLTFSGFSVEVFERCVKRLPYNLSYEFVGFGDGVNDPWYNAMVQKLVDKEVDGVVADITITEDRMRVVDFTQPYIQSSLVMVVPFDYASYGQLWNFLLPFSDGLWASIGAVFLSTGLVIFILEHDNLHFHQEGLDWKTRLANVFWFTAMTVFFCQKADISTRLGRVLTVFWLMVVLILTSSYTASLTSILAAQKPSPSIKNFADLQKSNLAVGYQDGSFTPGYLEQSLYIRPARLVPLVKEQDYDAALELGAGRKGGVAAILDESPYIQTFLNSKCQYTTVGNEIAYFGGFGFAFQKNSSLTDDISLTIISLEQNGELQNIKDSWLGSGKCVISSTGTYIPLKNFGGLFIIIAIVYSVCIFLRNLGWILEACGQNKDQVVSPIEELYPSQDTERVSPTEELHPPQHIVSLDPPQVSPIEELHPPQNTRPLDPLQVSPIEELHPPQRTLPLDPPQAGASRERTNIRM